MKQSSNDDDDDDDDDDDGGGGGDGDGDDDDDNNDNDDNDDDELNISATKHSSRSPYSCKDIHCSARSIIQTWCILHSPRGS